MANSSNISVSTTSFIICMWKVNKTTNHLQTARLNKVLQRSLRLKYSICKYALLIVHDTFSSACGVIWILCKHHTIYSKLNVLYTRG